jgi:hypothetical protein
MHYTGCRTVRGSADFRDSRARFREKKFTSADKKFREFFFLGVNPRVCHCVCIPRCYPQQESTSQK